MVNLNLEAIASDLQGISVFSCGNKVPVSHIREILEYPVGGITDPVYNEYVAEEWSSDDPPFAGGGGGDWYECRTISNNYIFVENVSGQFKEIKLYYEDKTVADTKAELEGKGHDLKYVLKRHEDRGPNWGGFVDTVYVL